MLVKRATFVRTGLAMYFSSASSRCMGVAVKLELADGCHIFSRRLQVAPCGVCLMMFQLCGAPGHRGGRKEKREAEPDMDRHDDWKWTWGPLGVCYLVSCHHRLILAQQALSVKNICAPWTAEGDR